MSCSCPDDAVPCKHIAGVYYGMVKTIDADPMWVFHFRGVDLPGLLRDRGSILTSPSRCSSRILLSGLRSPIPRGRQKRGTAKRSLCSRKLRADISSASRRFCPHRSRAGRRSHATAMKSSSPPVMSRSRSHEGQGHDVDELWNKFQSAFSGGRVLPELLWADGRFMMSLRIPRGRSLDASMMDRGRLIISLSELDGRTPASAPGLEPWSRVAKAAVMLLRQGAAVPVLVHLKTEGRDKVAAMWMPAMQAVGVRRFVEETGAILSKDVLGIFRRAGARSRNPRGPALYASLRADDRICRILGARAFDLCGRSALRPDGQAPELGARLRHRPSRHYARAQVPQAVLARLHAALLGSRHDGSRCRRTAT